MSTAFKAADILLPRDTADMSKWSVVACDQYTSQPEYWSETARIVGDSPSALDLILPEVYLGSADVDKRISDIHENMEKYLSDGLFTEYKNSMIYVERMTSDGMRAGIVGMIDLEEYDYRKGSTSSVRATEATVVERIPPRIKVRDGAPLELPHIMILIDDGMGTVIEPLSAKKPSMKRLYDFDLMQKGGHISGYLIPDEEIKRIDSSLTALGSKDAFNNRYGLSDKPVLLYAMGDGNHSLATAKEFYEKLKAENPGKDMSRHPARYALCEIVNLHSPALRFEAIHRIVSKVDVNALLDALKSELSAGETPSEGQSFTAVTGDKDIKLFIGKPTSNLTVGSLQQFLDRYLKENGGEIDYIHGEDVVRRLAEDKNSIGFLLPDMSKEELFPTVIKDGALPRKTFSMGHAEDKRFYAECRKITE